MEKVSKSRMSKFPLNLLQRLKPRKDGLSEFMDSLEEALIVFDEKLNFVRINTTARALFDVLGIDVEGKNILDVLPDIKETERYKEYLKVIRTGESYSAADIIPSSRFGNVHLNVKVFKVGNGLGMIVSDITGRKKLEQELKESEERYEAIVETSLDGIYQVDISGKFTFINEAFASTFGYKREELLGKQFSSLLSAEIIPKVAGMVKEVLAGKDVRDEVPVLHKDGHEVMVNFSATPLKDCGKIIGLTGILRDITERKRVEKALQDSEAKYRSLIETAGAGVATTDLRGEFVLVNEALCRMIGYSQEELLGRNFADFLHPDDKNEVLEIFAQGLAGEREQSHLEFKGIHKDGHNIWCYSTPTAIVHGDELIGFSAIIHDITKRKQAEEMLRDSEERFRSILENAPFGYYRVGKDGLWQYVNPVWERMHGFSLEEVIGKPFEITQTKEAVEQSRELVELALAREAKAGEFSRLRKDGDIEYYSFNIQPVKHGNEIVAIESFISDITERKRAEEALRQSEERFRNVLDNSLDMVYRLNLQTGRYDYVSPSTGRILGYIAEEFVGFSIEMGRSLAHPDDLARLDENVIELVTSERGTVSSIEYRIKHKELGYRWVSDSRSVVYDDANNPVAVVGTVRDINERKKEEEALRESEEKYRLLAENVTDVIWTMDMDLRFTYISPSVMHLRGLTVEEAMAERLEDIFSPSSFQALVEAFEEGIVAESTGLKDPSRSWTVELEEYCKDGSLIWVDIRAGLLRDQGGRPVGLVGVTRDITKRKQAEEAVRESEGKFRSVLEHSVDVIYQLNLKTGTYDYVSPSSMEALGYSPEELITLGFEKASSVIYPDDKEMILEHFNKLIKRSAADDTEPPTIEYRIQHRKLGYRWMSDTSSVLYDDNNGPIAIIGNVHDITERRKADEAQKDSEERYRALVNTAGLAGEGIMIVERPEGNKAVIAFVNDTLSGMLGYQREEMLGMPARDLFLPGDRMWLQDKNRRKRKGEALPSHYAVMALRKDGSMLPIEICMGAMRYQDKNATVVYVRDITERKKAEEALRESEAQFRAIFDGAAIGVGLLSIVGQPFRINPALQEMLGYTVEEFRSMAFTDYMHPDDATVDAGLFREMLRGKRDHYQVEKRYIRKDGQMVWGRMTLSAVRGLGGKFQFAIGMIEDVTERKIALENLRKSEKYFRALIENALEGISIIGRDGIITYGRPTVEPMLGHKPEEMIGWDFSRLVHPDDMPEVTDVYNRLMQNPGATIRTQLRVRHKDGSWLIVEAIARNLLDDPAVGGIVVNYRNVTEREQAHEELLRHTKQVEALYAIAQAASQTLELEELLSTSLDKVIEVMEAEAGCVYLLDMVEKELVLRTSRGLSDETISRLAAIKLNEDNVQKIKEWRGGSTPLRKIFEETGLNITAEVKEKEQIQSFAVAPFAVRGQLSGLIAVGNRAHRKFSPGDIDLLRAVGNQIGIGAQNAMLYEEVRALIRETIDAQETERERICLEVHDGVAQTLVSAFQYLQALEVTVPDDAQTKQLLAKTSAQVKQAIQESREIINSLQPSTLSDLGLVSTLRQELKRLGQETGLKIDFKADAIRLPKDIETGLYRIIREAVFNARKHANTKQLRVKISSEDERIRVEVRDWGKGFDQAYLDRARKRGTGLFSIRKRAELMKGACEIQSEPGQGTTVRVEIPVSATERSSG
jgi:PAS domain S-box-containing protein